MRLGTGVPNVHKANGELTKCTRTDAAARFRMSPFGYTQRELVASTCCRAHERIAGARAVTWTVTGNNDGGDLGR